MAAEVLKIGFAEEPSEYTNHVLVRSTRPGTFQVSGVSNRQPGAPDRLLTRHFSDLAEAMRVAVAWADERGIKIVYAQLV